MAAAQASLKSMRAGSAAAAAAAQAAVAAHDFGSAAAVAAAASSYHPQDFNPKPVAPSAPAGPAVPTYKWMQVKRNVPKPGKKIDSGHTFKQEKGI